MMESWRSKTTNNKILPRSKTNVAASCKTHPKHKQSPGVCSLCLNEKLFQVNNGGNSHRKVSKHAESSSVSDLSSLSSSNASSCASPVVHYARGMDSDALRFKKSKSMAFVLRTKNNKEVDRIKTGFWSKLLPRKKKGSSLMHSKTTREKGSLEFAAVVQIR